MEEKNITEFGGIGDGVTDNTEAFAKAVNYFKSTGGLLKFPPGNYHYLSMPNLAIANFKIEGSGSGITNLIYNSNGTAITIDAFDKPIDVPPFLNNLKIEGISIIGKNMLIGLFARGMARSSLRDIRINGTSGANGTCAFCFEGCMLNKFESLITSYVDGNVPYHGFFLKLGRRRGTSVGGCSNNIFEHWYAEGNQIGLQMGIVNNQNGGDQNVFLGGSAENCRKYGIILGKDCRYNSFMGSGFENKNIEFSDISDQGQFTRYIGCYSSHGTILQGTGIKISGGYYERIEIRKSADSCTIEDVKLNHWNTGNGGFYDSGVNTRTFNVKN